MKNSCAKWKDELLDVALGETAQPKLQDHLAQCSSCATELAGLRNRRQRLESVLPLIASAEEPSPDLHARVMAAAEAAASSRPVSFWRQWAIAGAAAVIAIAIVATFGWLRHRERTVTEAELRGAQALAEWRAPTDVLLRTPGSNWLSAAPKLGESYIKIPVETERGGK